MAMARKFEMNIELDPVETLPRRHSLSTHPSGDRLARLRPLMVERGLDGYLIVDSDAHYTFYAQARRDRRVNYITCSEVPGSIALLIRGTMWSCDGRVEQSGI